MFVVIIMRLQDYSADAWALGLCMLHLLTGNCPYEEVLADVNAPEALVRELHKHWDSLAQYSTLRQALACDDSDILANTLYRQCVLLGVPTVDELSAHGYSDNPVLRALRVWLCGDVISGRRSKAQIACQQQYERDVAACSLSTGTHTLLQRARGRLAVLPLAQSALMGLLSFFPTARVSLHTLPSHPMFTVAQ